MKRNIRVLSLLAAIVLSVVACKKDDGSSITPPLPYDEQYLTDKPLVEEYLQTHYIYDVDDDFNIDIREIGELDDVVSIWDQTDYPLQSKAVTIDDVDMTLYYLVLQQGVGEFPTRADAVKAAYKGWLLDGTQFDYTPYPQTFSSLAGTILGWQEIIPFFREGELVDEPNSPNPPSYENYGAGVMFIPSAYGYYNATQTGIPAYSPLVFSFKLYEVQLLDSDYDGILNKYETEDGIDIWDYDTDGDDIPNYLDTDDDGDGFTTRQEIMNPATGEAYDFDEIPTCDSGVKKHLDASCH